jgi:hypothetical protein
MNVRLDVVLECYSINPILERKDRFIWLGTPNPQNPQNPQNPPNLSNPPIPPYLEIGYSIEFIMINIKKIKLSLEDDFKYELQFPFTYNDFITFARRLASNLTKATTWIKNLQYMKDYILAPLMISSREIRIGIIILDNIELEHSDILESNNYLSLIKSKKDVNTNTNTNTNTNNGVECKCDMLTGILEMGRNKLSTQMKLYIMNCRGYIPPVLIRRMPKQIKAKSFFRKPLYGILAV